MDEDPKQFANPVQSLGEPRGVDFCILQQISDTGQSSPNKLGALRWSEQS